MYKHGAYGELLSTQDIVAPKGVSTLPVYFGRLPIHQLIDYSGKVNTPILIQNYSDAVQKVGYSGNWADFDLCEAIYAHFKNAIQPVGPIVLVNVLDPNTMTNAGKTSDISLTNSQGYLENDKVILNTVSITDKVLGVDFSVEYIPDGSKVLFKDLKGTLISPVTVTFDEVNANGVTKTDVIGGTNATTGAKSGISVVDLVYPTHNLIPTILDAPCWSHDPDVDAALKAAAKKINGHWYAWVNSNLSSASDTADTIEEAKTWKTTNNYTGTGEAPCWPMAKNGTRLFHISTLTTVTMQMTDLANDNIPFETPSNKPIDVTGVCLADGTTLIFDQVQANDLNSKGVRTIIYWGGRWVLWGSHTGAYEYGIDIDPRDKFDSNVRMLYYLMNDFQHRYSLQVDKPMSRSRVDTILNDYQEYLDSLIARGALLYARIEFTETSNPVSDIVEGDFDFDIATTITPPGKSLTAKVQYTTKGINTLFGGGDQT